MAEGGGEGLVADLEEVAQLGLSHGRGALAEEVEDLLFEVGFLGLRWRGGDLEVYRLAGEGEGDGVGGAGGAMFDGEAEVVLSFVEVEVGVPPAMVSPALC